MQYISVRLMGCSLRVPDRPSVVRKSQSYVSRLHFLCLITAAIMHNKNQVEGGRKWGWG